MCFIIVVDEFLLQIEIAQCFHLSLILLADDVIYAALPHISKV